jgi:hypothetical protein
MHEPFTAFLVIIILHHHAYTTEADQGRAK